MDTCPVVRPGMRWPYGMTVACVPVSVEPNEHRCRVIELKQFAHLRQTQMRLVRRRPSPLLPTSSPLAREPRGGAAGGDAVAIHPVLAWAAAALWIASFICDYVCLLDPSAEMWGTVALCALAGGVAAAMFATRSVVAAAVPQAGQPPDMYVCAYLIVTGLFTINLLVRILGAPTTVSAALSGACLVLGASLWLDGDAQRPPQAEVRPAP
jgi:uncharacterized membrane protein